MRNSIRAAIVVLAWLVALPVHATFHLWTMNELYSNADGSVQFLELTALTGGQQFLQGQTLTASGGGGQRSFTFSSNLPGDTSNRRMLIGTQRFAVTGNVTPDYVVPNDQFTLSSAGTSTSSGAAHRWSGSAVVVSPYAQTLVTPTTVGTATSTCTRAKNGSGSSTVKEPALTKSLTRFA